MPGRFSRLMSNRVFRALVVAHGLATIGQLQLTMAVGVDALDRTGAGLWVSIAVALGFLPYLLCSIPAGALADRYPRAAVLRLSIGLRLLTSLAVAVGLALQWPVPVIIAIAAATAVLATPSYPAVVASIPQVVPRPDLGPANTLVTGVENAAWVAGPGFLGLVLLAGAPPAGGAFAAAVFLAAALLALGSIATPLPVHVGAGPADEGLLAGFRAVRANPRIRLTMLLAGIDNFVYGYLVVAIVLVSQAHLDTGDRGTGLLNTALTTGALASMLVTWRLDYQRRAVTFLVVGLLAAAILIALIGGAGTLPVAMLLVLLAGLAQLVVETVAVTIIQESAQQHLAGRIFGVYDAFAVGLIALGAALAGGLADALSVTTSMALVGGATALATLLAGARLARLPATSTDVPAIDAAAA